MSFSAEQFDRCLVGDETALEELINAHQRGLFRLAYSILRDAHKADHAVRTGLFAAIRACSTYRSDMPLDHWLARFVYRTAKGIQQQDHFFKRRKPVSDKLTISEQAGVIDPRIWPAINRLSDHEQNLLILRYFHDHTTSEIAKILKTSQQIVKSRLRTARERLYLSLGGEAAPKDEMQIGRVGHLQARLFIQSALDDPLDSEAWLALQSHLDGCPQCREFQRQSQTQERDIQRALHAHIPIPADFPLTPAHEMLKKRQQLKWIKRRIAYSGLGFVGIVALFFTWAMMRPLPEEAVPTPSPSPTSQMPQAGTFFSPVLIESQRDGNSEIYLLDAGGQAVNLTNHPSEDSDPVWSPDGEWIAFFSNRSNEHWSSTQKREIYVVHVSGKPLLRLTNEPAIQWVGPMSWSPDGKTLAVTGRWQEDNNKPWLYLVPVNGTEVVRLSSTQMARNPRWSAEPGWLAFEQPTTGGMGIFARNVEYWDSYQVVGSDIETGAVFHTSEGSFDWSPNNRGILYVSNGPYPKSSNSISIVPDENTRSRMEIIQGFPLRNAEPSILTDHPMLDEIISVSWSPGDTVAYLQEDDLSASMGCHKLFLQLWGNDDSAPVEVPGLCVTQMLTDSAWTSDGDWLVVVGVAHNPRIVQFGGFAPRYRQPAIYALDVNYFWQYQAQVRGVREDTAGSLIAPQADPGEIAETIFGAVHLVRLSEQGAAFHKPQIPPNAPRLNIKPRENNSLQANINHTPQVDPAAVPWQIVFSGRRGSNTDIFTMRADGSELVNLTNHPEDDYLPAVSPDQQRIAFVSTRWRVRPDRVTEIFVMNADGSNPQQLTQLGEMVSYSHLSWSPDGRYIVGIASSGFSNYLVIAKVDGGKPSVIALVEGNYLPPVWNDDNSQIYIGFNSIGLNYSPSILSVKLSAPEQVNQVLLLNEYFRLDALEHAAGSNQLLIVATRPMRGNPQMEMLIWPDFGTERAILREEVIQPGMTNTFEMTMAPDSSFALARFQNPANSKFKTQIVQLNLADQAEGFMWRIENSWQFEDLILHQWISPDGNWLIYTSDSGVWLVDLRTDSRPKRIAEDYHIQLDWIQGERADIIEQGI